MSSTPSISHRIGEAIFTISSFCEEELTNMGETSNHILTYCAYIWFSGKLLDGCSLGDSADIFQSGRCQAYDDVLQTTMITKLGCMSLLAVAITVKCASSAFMHKEID